MKAALPLALLFLCGCGAPAIRETTKAPASKGLTARLYDSGFPEAHDTYNGMGAASDGKIYYVLSTASLDVPARMFVLDPASGKIESVGDLGEACGEKGRKIIPQGKSHVNFVEGGGRLWFATHIGYYSIVDGMETMGVPPPGYAPYAGGHFLAWNMEARKFEDYGVAPAKEGVITFTMDPKRGRLYGLTWPTGYFFRYDLAAKEMKNLGAFFEKGENGKGASYRTICRSLTVDPRDGAVYMSTGDGSILRYRYDRDAVEKVAGDNLRKDYFGLYEVASAGHMAYNWRQTFFREKDGMIYGVHGNSGYLFRFDPRAERLEVLDRITSGPSRRSGMFDQFSYGYLGFALGPDGDTIHYLTGGPVYVEGKRVTGKESTAKGESKGAENLHLVTWHIPTGAYTDHGPIFFEDGRRPTNVNAIAVGKDGTVYSISRFERGGKVTADLFSVPGPLKAR